MRKANQFTRDLTEKIHEHTKNKQEKEIMTILHRYDLKSLEPMQQSQLQQISPEKRKIVAANPFLQQIRVYKEDSKLEEET